MEQQPTRRPVVAAILSLFCAGLGHVYVGALRRGLMYFLVWGLATTQLGLLAVSLRRTDLGLWLLLVSPLVSVAISVASLVDSVRWARGGAPDECADCQRWSVYALFLLFACCLTWPGVVLMRAHYAEAFLVPTASMAPTIQPGDRLLVTKTHGTGWLPEHSDVVVYRFPRDREQIFVGRIVGLPGDRLAIDGGRVTLNGVAQTRNVGSGWVEDPAGSFHVVPGGPSQTRPSCRRTTSTCSGTTVRRLTIAAPLGRCMWPTFLDRCGCVFGPSTVALANSSPKIAHVGGD